MSSFPERLKAMEPFWGTWYLDELLGEGSYGKVYRIRRKEFDKLYYAALKWVPVPQNESEPLQHMRAGEDEASTRAYYREIVALLQNELVLMSTLRGNTNVVSYEDHQIVERKDVIGYDVLMRMELLTPLPQLVGKGMRVKDVMKLGLDLCSALMLCEQANIVHRDIKPDNIFKSEFGHYKLGDFGVAKQLEATQGAMSRKGTPHYMAPELMIGGDSGKEVDQYSLGLVLHNLLNGNRIPFVDVSNRMPSMAERDEAYRRRMTGVPIPAPILGSKKLKGVVCKAASYKAADRFPSAEALRDALLACKADLADETPLNTALLAGGERRENRTPTPHQDAESAPTAAPADPADAATVGMVPDGSQRTGRSTSGDVKRVTPLKEAGGTAKAPATGANHSKGLIFGLSAALVILLGVVVFMLRSPGSPPVPVAAATPAAAPTAVTTAVPTAAPTAEPLPTPTSPQASAEAFTAQTDGFGGPVTVTVIRSDGRITEVRAVGQNESEFLGKHALAQMPQRIIDANSPEVDVLAGATVTSEAIKEAVRRALAGGTAGAEVLTAQANGFGGSVTVKVTLDNGYITRVEASGSTETEGIGTPALDQMPQRIVDANSPEVDVVAGATVTSEAIKEAVRRALGEEILRLQPVTPSPLPDIRGALLTDTGFLQYHQSADFSVLHQGDVILGDLGPGESYHHAVELNNTGNTALAFDLSYSLDGSSIEHYGKRSLDGKSGLRFFLNSSLDAGTHTISWFVNGYEVGYFSGNVLAGTRKPKELQENSYGNWNYTIVDDGFEQYARINSMLGFGEGKLSIPGTLDGYPVKAVDDGAFYEAESVQILQIPNGIVEIGSRAFTGSHRLVEVNLPGSVQRIGDNPFWSPYLTKFVIADGQQYFMVRNGVLIERSTKRAIALVNKELAEVTVPNGVTTIGSYAFYQSKSLNALHLPEWITAIGSAAFMGCSSLSSVEIPNSVTRIEERTFMECSALTSVRIPDGTTSIGKSAFESCHSLESVTLPDGVTRIEDRAFLLCAALTTVRIPASVSSIGDNVFAFSEKVTILGVKGSYAEQYAKDNNIPFKAL